MRLHRTTDVPLTATVLLKCTSWMVPSPRRWEWSQEWHSELWYVHRASEKQHYALCSPWFASISFCLGAFKDALWLRRNSAHRTCQCETARGCGLGLLGVALLSFMILLILPGSRNAVIPGPTTDNQHLVLISRMGVSNASSPTVNIDEYERWKARGRHWLTDLSFYFTIQANLQFEKLPGRTISLGVASASLPRLLGLRLSSEAMDQARARHQPALILTRSGAEQYFSAASSLVGRTVKISGRDALIVGVLPGYAPLLPQRADAWLIVNDPQLGEYATGAPGFVLVQSSKAAEDTGSNGKWDFSMTEDGEPVGFNCVPLREQIPHPTHTFLLILLLAFLALPATTPLPLGEYPASEHPLFSEIRWRRWVFLGVKIGLLILIVYFTSIIMAFGNNRIAPPTSEYIQLVTSFVGLLFSFRWALRDQRLRCPVCLQRLSNPARVGHPSRSFLAWHGTEFMCDRGHGLLHVPEIATSWFGTQRWLSLDPSWKGLFPTLIQR